MKHRTGYLFKRGSAFYVRWTVEGKVFSKALRDEDGQSITSKREAEEARLKLMAPFTVADEADMLESIAGKLQGRKAELAKLDEAQNPPLPLTQAWSQYIASSRRPDTGPETLAMYEGQFRQFVDWMQARHPDVNAMRDVTEEIAEQYADSLNHGRLNPGTFNKHVNALTLVFRVLFKKAKLNLNPWSEIERKTPKPASRRELTIDELKKVCQSASGELRILLGLGIYTGLRLKDCATLRWSEVEMARNIIRRVPSKTARLNSKPVILPIHPVLGDMLREVPQENRNEYVSPKTADTYLNHKKQLINAIQKHFSDSDITVHKPGTGTAGKRAVVEVGFHSLRHTFVSMCRASDVPLSVVESLVGHSNPSMTRHYTHTGELAANNAIACLPALLGDSKTTQPINKRDAEAILRQVQLIAESITGKNWRNQKAALLMLLAQDRQSSLEASLKNENWRGSDQPGAAVRTL
jgi:integrase